VILQQLAFSIRVTGARTNWLGGKFRQILIGAREGEYGMDLG